MLITIINTVCEINHNKKDSLSCLLFINISLFDHLPSNRFSLLFNTIKVAQGYDLLDS